MEPGGGRERRGGSGEGAGRDEESRWLLREELARRAKGTAPPLTQPLQAHSLLSFPRWNGMGRIPVRLARGHTQHVWVIVFTRTRASRNVPDTNTAERVRRKAKHLNRAVSHSRLRTVAEDDDGLQQQQQQGVREVRTFRQRDSTLCTATPVLNAHVHLRFFVTPLLDEGLHKAVSGSGVC
ncbi:unnamed protein product [Lampetra fluviatilis]